MNQTIRTQATGAIAYITLTRPEIDAATIAELRAACGSIADDAAVRAAVLSGEGTVFSSGWAPALLGDAAALREAGALDDPFGCFAALPKPVVVAVNGDAVGGGLALALTADIRIASDTALFALPEVSAGLIPVAGATQRLARLVGRGEALRLVLTGETIDAAEALRIGLVSEVVPVADLSARATAIAERLAERGPIALQYAKEAVTRGIDMTLEQALRFETDLTVILQTTDDRAEGVQAFLDKRKPQFKGK